MRYGAMAHLARQHEYLPFTEFPNFKKWINMPLSLNVRKLKKDQIQRALQPRAVTACFPLAKS